MCYISLKRGASESASPLSQEFGGDRPRSSRPPSECLLFTPSRTLSGLLLLAFFFFSEGGGAFCVFFKIFLLEDQDRPKIHDQNVFALDFASEEAAILAAQPRGERGAPSGAPAAGDTV